MYHNLSSLIKMIVLDEALQIKDVLRVTQPYIENDSDPMVVGGGVI